MKYNRQDVKLFQDWGKNDKVISKMMNQKGVGFQPHIFQTGFYKAPSWNWAYQFGILKVGSKVYEVMTRFGAVEGGREVNLVEYTAGLEMKR